MFRIRRSDLPRRVCTKCGVEKDQEEFPFKNTARGIRHAVCNECSNKRSSTYYHNNQQKHIQSVNKSRGDYLAGNARYAWNYFSEYPCVDCGESNPVVLEFDHRVGVNKVERVSQMVTSGYSLERIIAEIEKCDVRCANCHRRKTAKERKWFSWLSRNGQGNVPDKHNPGRERARKFVHEYLSTQSCVDCGQSDPVVLEFDHFGDKTTSIAKMAADGFGIETIQREIEKCEVRCANCHRIKTANERGWFKWLSR